MKAIIHIGTAKAGSSAIQYFISSNRKKLQRAGFQVPLYRPTRQYGFHAYAITSIDNMGERRLSDKMGIRSQADLEAFRISFAKKAQDDLARFCGKKTHLLLSAEGLASCSVEEIERLRDLLAPYCSEFVVIVYLRRQDLRRVSQFRLGIKNHGRTSTSVFNNRVAPNLDYYALCDRWAQVFGDSVVVPRVFPDSTPESYDLIDDFAALSDIANIEGYAEFERPGRRNKAWDWRAVEFLRLTNDHLSAIVDGKVPKERKFLEEVLKDCFPECEQRRPPRSQAIRFYELYRESNEMLRARWFPQQASLFHEDFSGYPEQPDEYELTAEDIVFVASRLLQARPTGFFRR